MKLTTTKTLLASLILCSTLPLALAHQTGDLGDIDRINGDIEIGDNSSAGDLDTVNGDIEVGDASRIGGADTVNGDIELGMKTTAKSAETVNGSISGKGGNTIDGSVETVNGGIKFAAGADVKGSVETVNGDITLNDVRVGQNVETVNGDISLSGNSKVLGVLAVRKPKGSHFCVFDCKEHEKPLIKIGAGVEVGSIELEREVKLEVDAKAKVGKVEKKYEKK